MGFRVRVKDKGEVIFLRGRRVWGWKRVVRKVCREICVRNCGYF